MDPVIFLEKVRRPDRRGLVRSRLLESLPTRSEATGPSLGLVLAPPGSGKTTLLSHVAASGEAVAWYRVGAEDDDELALTRHLGHALGSAAGRPELVAAASSGQIAHLISALQDPTLRPATIVIDDLHEIAGTPAERALERFLLLRPRHLHVVLGSRRPPQLNISRLLVSGELRQLTGDDLRFRSWEVEELFRTVYDAPLPPESAAALTRRTGGWAAGLQLFHLASAGLARVERERAVEELSGRSRLIRSYLARNVLDGVDAGRRAFLLRTCTLGVLTGETCDALLHTFDSATVLAELEQQQFFTTSTDGGLTFRYHQVLQTHLEVLLVDELGSAEARRLYSRSADLLEAGGRTAAAVRAHARAEDWGSVARLLQPGSLPVNGDEAMWGLLSLPGAPTDDPGLVLAGARRLARHGLIAESVAAYRQAEALMDDPEFRRRCTQERTATAMWLPHAATPGRPVTQPVQLSAELRRITLSVAHIDETGADLVRGLAHLLTGDPAGAGRVLRHAGATPGAGAWEPLALRLAAALVELLERPDAGAAGRLEEIVLSADVGGWPWLSRLARSLQCALLLAFAPAPWRVTACIELLDDLERHGDVWTVCLASLTVGWAATATDQSELARRSLGRAEEVAADLGAPVLQAWSTLLQSADRAERVRPWAEALGLRYRSPFRALAPVSSSPRAAAPTDAQTQAGPYENPSPVQLKPINLSSLGGFSLTADGVEVPWRKLRPRSQSLLMMLAVHHGRRMHREHLVDALWPDAPLASGIRSLQVAVSAVRRCLVGGGLPADSVRRHGDAYALELVGALDQREHFERLAQQAAQQQSAGRPMDALGTRLAALQLYAGDLLPEVGPADWAVEERERLRLLAATVGTEAAEGALALGNWSAGLRAARRSVEIDPFHDAAWTLLVESAERLGDHSAAAVARRQHARVRAELGVVEPV